MRSIDLLKALRRMVNDDGTDYSAPWKQVPGKFKKDFKSWVKEYKQQDWPEMWEKAWYNYGPGYIRFLIDQYFLEGVE